MSEDIKILCMHYQKRSQQYTEEKNTLLRCEDLRVSQDLNDFRVYLDKDNMNFGKPYRAYGSFSGLELARFFFCNFLKCIVTRIFFKIKTSTYGFFNLSLKRGIPTLCSL